MWIHFNYIILPWNITKALRTLHSYFYQGLRNEQLFILNDENLPMQNPYF